MFNNVSFPIQKTTFSLYDRTSLARDTRDTESTCEDTPRPSGSIEVDVEAGVINFDQVLKSLYSESLACSTQQELFQKFFCHQYVFCHIFKNISVRP